MHTRSGKIARLKLLLTNFHWYLTQSDVGRYKLIEDGSRTVYWPNAIGENDFPKRERKARHFSCLIRTFSGFRYRFGPLHRLYDKYTVLIVFQRGKIFYMFHVYIYRGMKYMVEKVALCSVGDYSMRHNPACGKMI